MPRHVHSHQHAFRGGDDDLLSETQLELGTPPALPQVEELTSVAGKQNRAHRRAVRPPRGLARPRRPGGPIKAVLSPSSRM